MLRKVSEVGKLIENAVVNLVIGVNGGDEQGKYT